MTETPDPQAVSAEARLREEAEARSARVSGAEPPPDTRMYAQTGGPATWRDANPEPPPGARSVSRGQPSPVMSGTPPAASEGYPKGWLHAHVHLNPATGEMHADGDHKVRAWLDVRSKAKSWDEVMGGSRRPPAASEAALQAAAPSSWCGTNDCSPDEQCDVCALLARVAALESTALARRNVELEAINRQMSRHEGPQALARAEAALQAIYDDRLEEGYGITIERATVESRIRMREIARAALRGGDTG